MPDLFTIIGIEYDNFVSRRFHLGPCCDRNPAQPGINAEDRQAGWKFPLPQYLAVGARYTN
jgi:hypothetical protein